MSKNTGTSELINYFDLGVNGDVGIAGSLDINTIANATTDTDTFLVSDTGIIKYRTGVQLLSDIGAAPATGGSYLPLAGGTLTGTTRMDGSGGTVPSITMIYNSGINRLLAPLLRLYGATNEASNYIELFGTLATSNRTINFPDASGTVALTSNIPANPVGGTGTSGTIPVFTGSTTIGNSIVQSNATQVNVVGNGSQLLFDSLGSTKDGGIQYVNDFTLQMYNSRGVGSSIYLGNNNLDLNINPSSNPRLRIESNGNVGISTSTPTSSFNARLAVRNEDAANNPTLVLFKNINSASSEDIFRVQSWNGAFNTVASIRANGSATFSSSVTVDSLIIANNDARIRNNDATGRIIIGNSSTNTFAIFYGTSHPTQANQTVFANGGVTTCTFSSTGAAAFGSTVTANGNFGTIAANTSSAPQYYLTQTGGNTYSAIGINRADGTGIAAGIGSALVIRSGDATDFPIQFATANNVRATIATSGNFLIGTTTDSGYKLFVNGASYLDGYNYASSIQYTRAVSNTVNPAGGNGVLIFSGGQAAMRMDSAYTMHFDVFNGGNSHSAFQIRQNGNTVSINSPNNSLPLELKFQNVASGYLGAISSALYAYSVNGGYVLLNSASAWVPASDIKRKRNFEPYTKGLSAILGLQPKLYNMDFQKDGDEKQVGLVAQEVRDFIPLAYEENADFIGINYNAVIVTMVKAIQEQQQQIQELKNKLS